MMGPGACAVHVGNYLGVNPVRGWLTRIAIHAHIHPPKQRQGLPTWRPLLAHAQQARHQPDRDHAPHVPQPRADGAAGAGRAAGARRQLGGGARRVRGALRCAALRCCLLLAAPLLRCDRPACCFFCAAPAALRVASSKPLSRAPPATITPPSKRQRHHPKHHHHHRPQDFYFDVFDELSRFGEVEALHVCDNLGEHLVGNVYAKYRDEEDAARALTALQVRRRGGGGGRLASGRRWRARWRQRSGDGVWRRPSSHAWAGAAFWAAGG